VNTPLSRLLAPLSRRLRLMVSRAVITAVQDAGKIQTAQVTLLEGEVRDGVEILHQYGFTSVPAEKGEGLYFSVGGDRDHGVMVALADRKFRKKNLEPGEAAVYTDEDAASGDHHIHFKRGRIIEIVAGASRIVMEADGITITTPALAIQKTEDR
jgi:phage baseplate assembly protein V